MAVQVAEGVTTAGVVVALAARFRVFLPVLTAVAQVCKTSASHPSLPACRASDKLPEESLYHFHSPQGSQPESLHHLHPPLGSQLWLRHRPLLPHCTALSASLCSKMCNSSGVECEGGPAPFI